MRPGDRVSFYPVSDDDLIVLREQVYDGSFQYEIKDGELNVGDYLARLEEIKPETEAFKRRQQEAAERTPVP
jgi:urea carboxylase